MIKRYQNYVSEQDWIEAREIYRLVENYGFEYEFSLTHKFNEENPNKGKFQYYTPPFIDVFAYIFCAKDNKKINKLLVHLKLVYGANRILYNPCLYDGYIILQIGAKS